MKNPFENISVKNKEKLLRRLKSHTVNYKKGTTILELIEDKDEIGIIVNGYINIIKNNYNGSTNLIEELYENDVFSSSSIYVDSDYEIVAKEDVKLIIINLNELINYEENDKIYNQFIKNLFIILNEKINEKNERIEILTKKTIRNRLLEYFNIMSKKTGSRFIYLPFNFINLADYLAIDRSAMSRELKYLREEGFIEVKGKRITLLYR